MKAMMIIFLMDPLGHYLDKVAIPYPTVVECQRAAISKPDELGYKKVCVTIDHWTGKSVDKNVPLEMY